LIQQYADQIRYSAFGYLNDPANNDANVKRDGGVLRAQQKFVGPTQPVPGGGPISNPASEWNASNGVMEPNPDAADAATTAAAFSVTVANSGVMNYLNKFGQLSNIYKRFDPVGELYYTALRYYKKLGSVPEYVAGASGQNAWIDGFPVITDWKDPIQYSCQKNFILGIGDVNTHADRNLPGASGNSEPGRKPLLAILRNIPAHVYPAFRLVVEGGQRGRLDRIDRDPRARLHDTDDAIARHGAAIGSLQLTFHLVPRAGKRGVAGQHQPGAQHGIPVLLVQFGDEGVVVDASRGQ